ncbi:neurogenic locus notch homolog protein 1 isoform X2 [Patella vulgata]|nr:neurogenic locus notch homolog protein 1 isoform X2 [Patella vulgata]
MNISEQWNHCILTWNQSTRNIGVYIGGKLVKSKTVSSVTSSLLVTNTTMEIDVTAGHEIIIRRIQLSSSGLVDGESIRDLSKSCDLTIPTQPLISMSDLKSDNQNFSNLRIVVPSSCDAVNECLSSPCGQHVCINDIDGFKCHCTKGYTGEMCSIAPDYCISNGCMNGATCINDLQYGIFTCNCSQNFTGRLCDVAIVHGNWGEWGDWSQCSTTCGGGQQSRTRICDNPIPSGGGDFCKGIVSNTRTCNNNECPKCLSSDLIRAYGTNIDCNGDVTKLVCKGTCDPGTAFIGDQPTYNCTYGVWTPGTQAEPCIDVLSPDDLQVNATLEFPFVPCDKRGDFKNMVSNKISQDTCSGNGLCNSEIKVSECDRTNRRRREATTTVEVILTKTLPGGDLNLPAYQINGTVSPQLQAIVEAVQVLEISGQTLQNETDNYNFEVNGENYKASSVNIVGSTICQDGAIGASGICVLCPEGTYQNVEICTLCERGYYQDERGQTNCKSCPNGWSTQYTGSMNLTKCSIPSVMTPVEPEEKNTNLVAIIASVIGCIVLLAILILVFIYIKKRRAQNDKAIDSRPTSSNDKVDFEMESSSTLPSKDHFKQ